MKYKLHCTQCETFTTHDFIQEEYTENPKPADCGWAQFYGCSDCGSERVFGFHQAPKNGELPCHSVPHTN